MDFVPPVTLSPGPKSTYTRVRKAGATSADPYFVESQASKLVGSYLNGADPTAPKASPLNGDLTGVPPVRVHVGEDEVLLDDSLRFVARAVEAGVDARVDVWQGMAHGFASGVGTLAAATQAVAAIGAFLAGRLDAADTGNDPTAGKFRRYAD